MPKPVKPMPFLLSLLLFGIPSLVLILATRLVIPWLHQDLGLLPVLSWFLAGGVLVFIPLFLAACIAFRWEGNPWDFATLRSRFRLHRMEKKDWLWTIGGIAGSFFVMGLIIGITNLISDITELFEPLSTQMPFMEFHGLEVGQFWVLLVWLPFFFFNIVGEELWWRGYILPRQELRHGKHAWVVNGALWLVFHIAFGLGLMLMMIPVLFIHPYIVQKRKNTWIGIWIHGIFNGPIFVAIALNLIN